MPHRGPAPSILVLAGLAAAAWVAIATLASQSRSSARAGQAGAPPSKPDSSFVAYTETIPESTVTFKMVPIPGGRFLMGTSAADQKKFEVEDEGPRREVEIKPFWMGVHEVTWPEFDIFAFKYDIKAAKLAAEKGTPLTRTEKDVKADGVSRPTPPYVDMTFGYGQKGYPAICMTQHAAAKYCEWLSAKTGKHYRLPTEAEWEYACRTGTKTHYHFGDDPALLGQYCWHSGNSDNKPHPIGMKKPNPWGLYDIHGNVSEWCQDKYVKDYFSRLRGNPPVNPLVETKVTVWHAVRGGSWDDEPVFCRAAARRGADEEWSIQDPQQPKSIWWHTDARFVGFRVVRPYEPPK